jgi:hypothetical protein
MEENLYKAEELRNLDIKPKINDISLNILQDYYKIFFNAICVYILHGGRR